MTTMTASGTPLPSITPASLDWPRGFRASVGAAAIKKPGRDDLALLAMPEGASAAHVTRGRSDSGVGTKGSPRSAAPAEGSTCAKSLSMRSAPGSAATKKRPSEVATTSAGALS